MKVYNRTRISTELLTTIAALSGKMIGARISNVPVIIRNSQYRSHGMMYPAISVRKAILTGKKSDCNKWVKVDGGWIEVWIPTRINSNNFIALAEGIFNTCLHEWQHIRDAQQHVPFDSHDKRWRNRHHEIRACACVQRKIKDDNIYDTDPLIQDAVIELAVYFESLWNKREV